MKKILTSLLILFFIPLLSSCEERGQRRSGLVAPGQSLIINVWSTKEEAGVLKDLGREFSSELGEPGLHIKVISFDSQEEMQNLLVTQMAEDKGPDIIYTDANWIHQNPEKIVSLGSSESFSVAAFKERYVRSASDVLISNQTIKGIPMGVDSLALIYNEDYLINVLDERSEPGRSWETFREDVIALNRPDNSFERFSISGAALGRGDNINNSIEILENIMIQMGTQFFDFSETKATFASTQGISSKGKRENAGVEAFSFFTTFADKRYDNFSWSEFLASAQFSEKDFGTFAKGKVSMVFGFSRDLEKIKDIIKSLKNTGGKPISEKSIRVAFLPQVEDPNVSHYRVVKANLFALAVPRTTKQSKIAWSFLKFTAKKDQHQDFYEETGLPTPLLSLLSEQEQESELGIFVRQAKFARPNLIPLSKEEYNTGFKKTTLLVNNGEVLPRNGLKSLENEFTELLTKRKRQMQLIK